MFSEILFIQLQTFETQCRENWANINLMNNLIDKGIAATSHYFPDYFSRQNKCYKHTVDALSFLYRVKVYSQTNKNNKSRIETARAMKAQIQRTTSNQIKNRKLNNVKNL